MMPPKSGKALMALLVVSSLLLAAVIAWEWAHPPRLDLVTTSRTDNPPTSPEPAILKPEQMAPIIQYREIVERPLFLEARRPPQPEAPAVVVQEMPVEEDKAFTLIGVLMTPEAEQALLKVDETGKVHRVRVGEKLENWQLETIAADSVVLRRDAKTRTLQLIRNQKKPTVGPTAQEALRQRLLEQQRRRASLQNIRAGDEQNNPAATASDGTPLEQVTTQ